MNSTVLMGAILGLTAVIAGALTGHGPIEGLDPGDMSSLMTAIRYHHYGAIMTAVTGLVAVLVEWSAVSQPLRVSSWLFVAGTLLFSFSIYGRILLGFDWLGPVTPLGGLCHMAGWIALGWAAWALRYDAPTPTG